MNPDDAMLGIRSLLEAQRNAHRLAPFPSWSVRRNRLQRMLRLLETSEAAIEGAIDADFGGRPRIETQMAELFPALGEIRAALRRGERWMKPRRAAVAKWFLPARACIVPRPLGVVGIIVPWNYPLFLAVAPMVGALAAGNRVMVKMSEHTPAFAALWRRLVGEQFGADEIAVVTGGPEVGAEFAALPLDHLFFTGAAGIGRKVMQAAAENLTPVTLELGGKSPAVVAPGYPLANAARRIVAGKLINAGQTCIAPDYVLVQRGDMASFVEQVRRLAREMYPGGLADPDYCSIAGQHQYDRLVGYLDEAASAGVVAIEPFEGAARDPVRHRLAPVIWVEPPFSLAAMREEIFGPILPVLPYDEPHDAIAHIEAQPRPLAMYWFDQDRRRASWAIRHTHVGGACINDTLLHVAQPALPFGGVGSSGMGHYHGRWGFDSFSKLTPVFRQSRLNALGLFTPPYRPTAYRLLERMKRW